MGQTMFRPPFLGPSSCEVSSVDPEKGCSVALEAAEEVCCPDPRLQRPSDQSRHACRPQTGDSQLHPEPVPVADEPIAAGLRED